MNYLYPLLITNYKQKYVYLGTKGLPERRMVKSYKKESKIQRQLWAETAQ